MSASNSFLYPWPAIASRFDSSSGLLLGNGFSITCWPDFRYASLFERASQQGFLDERATQLFDGLGTVGFEVVLDALRHARSVARAWGEDTSRLEETESCVRYALFSAVRDVHVPHPHLTNALLPLAEELRRFRAIFTTNYDLIPYWSFMAASAPTGAPPCIDFFHKGKDTNAKSLFFSRERAETDLQREATWLFYLHGGLHLFQNGENVCKVRQSQHSNEDTRAILQWIERENHEPLIVTEGQAARKRAFIHENPYLDWAFEQFEAHDAPLVIFGHSLNMDADGHLLDVLCKWSPRAIALSVYPSDPAAMENVNRLDLALKSFGHEPLFFDCREHPLAQALEASKTGTATA